MSCTRFHEPMRQYRGRRPSPWVPCSRTKICAVPATLTSITGERGSLNTPLQRAAERPVGASDAARRGNRSDLGPDGMWQQGLAHRAYAPPKWRPTTAPDGHRPHRMEDEARRHGRPGQEKRRSVVEDLPVGAPPGMLTVGPAHRRIRCPGAGTVLYNVVTSAPLSENTKLAYSARATYPRR